MSKKAPLSKLLGRDINDSLGKLPPQAIDLEESVLGNAIMEKNSLLAVINILKPDDFYLEAHKIIYGAMLEMHHAGKQTDMRSIIYHLRQAAVLEVVGGAYKVAELTSKVVGDFIIEQHALIVKENSIKREIIQLASEMHYKGYDDTSDALGLLNEIRSKLLEIENNVSAKPTFVRLKDGLLTLSETISKRKDSNEDVFITGVGTGYIEVDKLTAGWQPTDLIIIAARPGMGKTAFVICNAINTATMFNIPVAIFSLEMSSVQLIQRMVSIKSEIELKTVRHKKFDDPTWQRFIHSTVPLANAEIFIDDTPALHVLDFRNRCRKLVEENKVGLIIVDYIQLMRGEKDRGSSRENEINNISQTLKRVAKELNVPVIALSQLSRAVETRSGSKRPQLSDLRESGAIEQDADIVGFLYRPEYYKINYDEDGNSTQGLAEFIIAKNRNGDLKTINLRFIGKTTKFMDYIVEPLVKNIEIVVSPMETNQFPKANPDETPF